jgi:acyl carrier protein
VNENVEQLVIRIVMEQLSVAEDEIIPNDLGANEIDKVVLIESFKEEFGVEIPDDAAKTILTVGDAIKFLEKASAA